MFPPKLEFTLNSPSTIRSFPSPRFPRAKYTDSTASSSLSCHTVAGGDDVSAHNSRDRRLPFTRNSRHSPSLDCLSAINSFPSDACPAGPNPVGPTLLLFLFTPVVLDPTCVLDDAAARIPTSTGTPDVPRSRPPPVTPAQSTPTDVCSHRSARFRFKLVTILYTSCEPTPVVLFHCDVFSLPSHAS